jgi:hypothetical protein
MSTTLALIDGFTSSDCSFTCRGNDTRDTNNFSNIIALKISEHDRILIRTNLDLEFGSKVKWQVVISLVIYVVDHSDARLKSFHDIVRVFSQTLNELIVESYEMAHFNFDKVETSLSITFQLFSIDKSVSNLSFTNKMHEL